MSATPPNPWSTNQSMGALGKKTTKSDFASQAERLGLSPRQRRLNRLWSYYTCNQYDSCRVDWDGRERVEDVDADMVATQGFLPPGMYDAGAMFPLKFRKPSAPYHLVRVVIARFTGLLFSSSRHPQIRVEGDPDTEDFQRTLAEASHLWAMMLQARALGGAMGTVAMGFQFLEGKPVVEVHDPRWLFPEFEDRQELRLSSIEKRFMFPIEMRNPKGEWEEVMHWYRRVINAESDTVWKPVPVGDGKQEPPWYVADEEGNEVPNPALVQAHVVHNLSFCPVIWIQNLPVGDDIDGEPDCHGALDMSKEIDGLLAQAGRGTKSNCDPTVVVTTTASMGDLRKGSDNALKIPDGDAKYMEISGSGPKAALDMAATLRSYFLEMVQCVLEHPDVANRTATEVERSYESMYAKADVLREQYGERGVKPLLRMMVKAAQSSTQARAEDGQIVRGALVLPPKVVKVQAQDDDGNGQPGRPGSQNGNGRNQNGNGQPERPQVQLVERRLGKFADRLETQLQWPPYIKPTVDDALKVVQASTAAKMGQLVDGEHAAKKVAPYFDVEDVQAMMDKVKKEASSEQAQLEAMALSSTKQVTGEHVGPGGAM